MNKRAAVVAVLTITTFNLILMMVMATIYKETIHVLEEKVVNLEKSCSKETK